MASRPRGRPDAAVNSTVTRPHFAVSKRVVAVCLLPEELTESVRVRRRVRGDHLPSDDGMVHVFTVRYWSASSALSRRARIKVVQRAIDVVDVHARPTSRSIDHRAEVG